MGRQEVMGLGFVYLGWGWANYAVGGLPPGESMYLAGALFVILGAFIMLDGLILSRLLVLGWVRFGALLIMVELLRDWNQFQITGSGPIDFLPELLLYGLGALFIVGGVLVYWFTHDISVDDLRFEIKQRLTLKTVNDELGRAPGIFLGLALVLFALFNASLYLDWWYLDKLPNPERLATLSILIAVVLLFVIASSLAESVKGKNLPFAAIGGFFFLWGVAFLVLPIGDTFYAIVLIIAAILLARFSDGLESVLYEEEEDIFERPTILPQEKSSQTEIGLKIGFMALGLFLILWGIIFIGKRELLTDLVQNIFLLGTLVIGILLHLYFRIKNVDIEHPLISAMTMFMLAGIVSYGFRVVVVIYNVIRGIFDAEPAGDSIIGLGLMIAAFLVIFSGRMFLNHVYDTCSMREKSVALGVPLALLGLFDLLYAPIALNLPFSPVSIHTLTVSGGLLGGHHLLEGIAFLVAVIVIIGYPKLKSTFGDKELISLALLLPILLYGFSLIATFSLQNIFGEVSTPYEVLWNRGVQMAIIAGVFLIIFFAINSVNYYLKVYRYRSSNHFVETKA